MILKFEIHTAAESESTNLGNAEGDTEAPDVEAPEAPDVEDPEAPDVEDPEAPDVSSVKASSEGPEGLAEAPSNDGKSVLGSEVSGRGKVNTVCVFVTTLFWNSLLDLYFEAEQSSTAPISSSLQLIGSIA